MWPFTKKKTALVSWGGDFIEMDVRESSSSDFGVCEYCGWTMVLQHDGLCVDASSVINCKRKWLPHKGWSPNEIACLKLTITK
jgi:hypothetical protein